MITAEVVRTRKGFIKFLDLSVRAFGKAEQAICPSLLFKENYDIPMSLEDPIAGFLSIEGTFRCGVMRLVGRICSFL